MITCYHDNSLLRPIAHLSLSLSFSHSVFHWLSIFLLMLFIFFVVTPTHPSVTSISYFNSSTEDSTYSYYLICLFVFFSWSRTATVYCIFFLMLVSQSNTFTASGREALQQNLRGQSNLLVGLFGGWDANLTALSLEQLRQAPYVVCVKVKSLKTLCEPQQ